MGPQDASGAGYEGHLQEAVTFPQDPLPQVMERTRWVSWQPSPRNAVGGLDSEEHHATLTSERIATCDGHTPDSLCSDAGYLTNELEESVFSR